MPATFCPFVPPLEGIFSLLLLTPCLKAQVCAVLSVGAVLQTQACLFAFLVARESVAARMSSL